MTSSCSPKLRSKLTDDLFSWYSQIAKAGSILPFNISSETACFHIFNVPFISQGLEIKPLVNELGSKYTAMLSVDTATTHFTFDRRLVSEAYANLPATKSLCIDIVSAIAIAAKNNKLEESDRDKIAKLKKKIPLFAEKFELRLSRMAVEV